MFEEYDNNFEKQKISKKKKFKKKKSKLNFDSSEPRRVNEYKRSKIKQNSINYIACADEDYDEEW